MQCATTVRAVRSLRVSVLASHEGTTAQAVIDACATGSIAGDVVVIISNNLGSGALQRAAAAGIPWLHLSGRTHPDAADLDAAICEACESADASVIVLAGYMKRLGPKTIAAFEGRIINTHPALLPAFGGQGMYGDRVHEAVLAAGERTTGASVHIVTAEYDEGPVLRQLEVPVLPRDTVESLGARVRAAEKRALVDVLASWPRPR